MRSATDAANRATSLAHLARAIAEVLGVQGADVADARWDKAGRSALNDIRRLRLGRESCFVKIGSSAALPMYEAEAAALRELAQSGAVRVPRVIAAIAHDNLAALALEWLDLDSGGRDAQLGDALAALHRVQGRRFGWHRDNTIGTTPQLNGWEDDWAVFFRDRRLAPQLALARHNGHGRVADVGEQLLDRVPSLLQGHRPQPSLLHGDLWSGNAARTADGAAVVFDPATYYGDREADLAMTELFGGFAPDFHRAYRDAWPLDAGYTLRKDLYNLYHVLNHVNLFGGAYVSQAHALTASLLAHAR